MGCGFRVVQIFTNFVKCEIRSQSGALYDDFFLLFMNNDKKSIRSANAPTHPFRHSLPLQIRFNDIDTLGHVNNSVYFPFFDLGKANYFNAVRGEVIDWKKADIVVANINCDFLAPVYFSERIEVRTQVDHVGDKSFRMIQAIVNADTHEVKCLCATIMVGFDIARGCAAPIADEWKIALNAFEGRDLAAK